MTTKILERLYPQLSVAERFPAMLAAYDRGDEVEVARLAATTPRIHVSLPDTHAHAEAFLLMIAYQQMAFLTIIGWLGRFKTALLGAKLDGDKKRLTFAENGAAAYAWRLALEEDAWRAFCKEIGSDHDPLSGLPGDDLRGIVSDSVMDAKVSTEDLAARMNKPASDFFTVEKRLQALRDQWQFWLESVSAQ